MGSETIVSPGGVRKLREDITSNTQAITSSNAQISKLSEGMTYVVVGDKSVETATIPVGSYVRLVNSNITGRSDGIYTVATAIPVDTVINGTYFKESAPIQGGLGNALNSKITTINSNLFGVKDLWANTVGTAKDLNTLEIGESSAIYHDTPNRPQAISYGFCVCFGVGSYKFQVAYDIANASNLCSRVWVGSAWKSWVQITSHTELASVENGLANRETGATASRNISNGDYVFWNGAMYRANGNIASGTTLVYGTNLKPTENAINVLNGNMITKSMLFVVSLGTVTTDKDGLFELPSDYATPWYYRPLSFWNSNGGNDIKIYTCIGHRQNKILIKVTDASGNIIASTDLTNTNVLIMKLN